MLLNTGDLNKKCHLKKLFRYEKNQTLHFAPVLFPDDIICIFCTRKENQKPERT